jgi:hypothetical protein
MPFTRASIFLPYIAEYRDSYIVLVTRLREEFGGITYSQIPPPGHDPKAYSAAFQGEWVEKDQAGRPIKIWEDRCVLWLIVDINTESFPNWHQQLLGIDRTIREEFQEKAGWVMQHQIDRVTG